MACITVVLFVMLAYIPACHMFQSVFVYSHRVTIGYSARMTSTRRFFVRPATDALSAMGRLEPYPWT